MKNNDRKGKIQNIRELLSSLGEKGEKGSSCLKVLRRGTYLYKPIINFPKVDVTQPR